MYRFRLRYVFIVVIVIWVLSGVLFFAWATNAQGPSAEALAALQSDNSLQVTTNQWFVFQPQNVTVTTGFIFYPGGRIEPRSYAPYARAIAAQGYLVVIVPEPLNLAIFNTNAAREVINAYPQITHWAVGGHSLGGVAAADFVRDNPDVQGLVLWASYPQDRTDLSSRDDLVVASIYGTNDQLATVSSIEASQVHLPALTTFVAITGGTHGQFGWYGDQPGDGQPTISHEEQQRETVAATVAVLQQISQR
ncbi:MAG: alpha/beta hydrolase [Anaerolineae bacterium]